MQGISVQGEELSELRKPYDAAKAWRKAVLAPFEGKVFGKSQSASSGLTAKQATTWRTKSGSSQIVVKIDRKRNKDDKHLGLD